MYPTLRNFQWQSIVVSLVVPLFHHFCIFIYTSILLYLFLVVPLFHHYCIFIYTSLFVYLFSTWICMKYFRKFRRVGYINLSLWNDFVEVFRLYLLSLVICVLLLIDYQLNETSDHNKHYAVLEHIS
jgi:hypothetical protein